MIMKYCSLHEYHRDPSMVLRSRGQSGAQKPQKRKYHPRSNSSLNFSSELPIVMENDKNEVGTENHAFRPFLVRKRSIFNQKNIRLASLKFQEGLVTKRPKFQIKISPRLLNIFNWKFLQKKTMNLLIAISTFPALSDEFPKWHNHT